LIEAVDAVEESRGYQPAMFVDIRLSRSVRAVGFNGAAFEKAVGTSRYRWMDDLGNLAIREGGPMRIKNPRAAETLLDLAETCARSRRRVVFFCSCEFPGVGREGCHRVEVARLLLGAAENRGISVQVVEWPGGQPDLELELEVPRSAFDKLCRAARTIPLEEPVAVAQMAAVPWFSLVCVSQRESDEEESLLLVTGPARYKSGWYLPVYEEIFGDMSDSEITSHIRELRERCGFDTRASL
jgi:hypothetical protein